MATSGGELTRIGSSNGGVLKALSITAKAAYSPPSLPLTRIGASIHGVGIRLNITAKSASIESPIKKVRRFICNVNKMGMR